MFKNDTIKYNNERVEKAGDENEMWKIDFSFIKVFT